MTRPYNFSPGPATLPEAVLLQAADEMLSWRGTGMSVMEMSHRGKHFTQIAEQAEADLRSLLGLTEDHRVVFLQGGASGQNAFVPMNLLGQNPRCDYIDTGHWSQKSLKEAARYGDVHVVASAAQPMRDALGEWQPYTYLPELSADMVRADAAYVHLCGNETIGGVEYQTFPWDVLPPATQVPRVVDMSSHILSRPMDFSQIDLAYGGAQKNIGPSGLTFAIVQRRLIEERCPEAMSICPSVFDYRLQAANQSMLNTPSTYALYLAGLVFQWLLGQGGVPAIAEINRQKAALLYGALDASSFYSTRVHPQARSWMNIPFFLPEDRLMAPFLEGAEARGLLGLKGHKAVGGLRASIYNAMPLSGVEALVAYLAEFEKEHA